MAGHLYEYVLCITYRGGIMEDEGAFFQLRQTETALNKFDKLFLDPLLIQ